MLTVTDTKTIAIAFKALAESMRRTTEALKVWSETSGQKPGEGVTGDVTESEHKWWCGDVTLSRPVDKCTCHITPEQQAKETDETAK